MAKFKDTSEFVSNKNEIEDILFDELMERVYVVLKEAKDLERTGCTEEIFLFHRKFSHNHLLLAKRIIEEHGYVVRDLILHYSVNGGQMKRIVNVPLVEKGIIQTCLRPNCLIIQFQNY